MPLFLFHTYENTEPEMPGPRPNSEDVEEPCSILIQNMDPFGVNIVI